MHSFMGVLLVYFWLGAGLARAEDEPPMVEPNQAIIQVKGVVCSFCAYGAEKNLARLDFLDPSPFGGNGVLVDIHTHRITLALAAGKSVDYAAIDNAILKGGYDPVATYLHLRGTVDQGPDGLLLTSAYNGQTYALTGERIDVLAGVRQVELQGHLDRSSASDPVAVIVTAYEVLPRE